MHPQTRHLTRSALFIASGILIPILFHSAGLGSVFLPMFWPLTMAPFFVPWTYALIISFTTPLLSMLMTGMPPIPILYIMMIELSALSLTLSFLYRWTRLGSLPLITAGLLASRIALYGVVMIFGRLLGLSGQQMSIFYVLKSILGVAVIILVIPLLLYRISKEPVFWRKEIHV